jgi:hypothetical protein
MYSISEVAKVFHQISIFLQDKQTFFAKEGIFRLSGSQNQANEIISQVLQGKFNRKFRLPRRHPFTIHDFVSALKIVLHESQLLNTEDLSIQMLKDSLESASTEQAAFYLQEYIEGLINSSNKDESMVGEILYRYFHLTTQALVFQEKNKMNAENLGSMMGPNIEKLINNDPQKIAVLIFKLNDVCAHLLQSSAFSSSFEQAYPDKLLAQKSHTRKRLAFVKKEEVEKLIDLETNQPTLLFSDLNAQSQPVIPTAKSKKKKILRY